MSTASNRLELVIDVDSKSANRALGEVNSNISVMERQFAASAQKMSRGWGGIENSAAGAAQGFVRASAEIRQAASWGDRLKGLGGALDTVLKPLRLAAYILPGLGVAGIISLIGDLILKVTGLGDVFARLFQSEADIKRQNDELTKSIREQVKELDDFYDRIEKIQRARAGLGLSGSARAKLELDQARTDMEKTKVEYNDAMEQYNRLQFELLRAKHPKTQGFTGNLDDVVQRAVDAQKLLEDSERKYIEAKESFKNRELEYEISRTEELKRQQDERLKNLNSYISATQALEISAIQHPAWRIVAQSQADLKASEVPVSGVGPAEIAARQKVINAKVVSDLVRIGQESIKGIDISQQNLEQSNRVQREAYSAKQQGLDDFVKKSGEAVKVWEDNHDRMVSAEERLGAETQRNYERIANSIEGFIHRTFLTARSFKDVWKQALMQVADFAISQFSRMAAAWSMGFRPPAAAGGGGIGIAGAMAGMVPGLGGAGGGIRATSPPFLPSSSGGAAGSGGVPLVGSPGGGLFNFGGLGGGLKDFFGFGKGATANLQQQIAGGPGLFGNLGKLATSNAAAITGGLLALAGVQRGGWSGFGMTTAGGALLGAKLGSVIPGLGTALGAGIGAAAGALTGLVGLFREKPEDEARKKIKSAYGIDIPDKGVLRQVVGIAKQSYGGNINMAVRSQQIIDLVRLYALTTGQSLGRLPQEMTPIHMTERGGGLFQDQSYLHGMPTGDKGRITIPRFATGIPWVPRPMLAILDQGEKVVPAGQNRTPSQHGSQGERAASSTIVANIKIDARGTANFLEGRTLTVISKNPRQIQRASIRAMSGNSGTRESLALLVRPGTIMR